MTTAAHHRYISDNLYRLLNVGSTTSLTEVRRRARGMAQTVRAGIAPPVGLAKAFGADEAERCDSLARELAADPKPRTVYRYFWPFAYEAPADADGSLGDLLRFSAMVELRGGYAKYQITQAWFLYDWLAFLVGNGDQARLLEDALGRFSVLYNDADCDAYLAGLLQNEGQEESDARATLYDAQERIIAHLLGVACQRAADRWQAGDAKTCFVLLRLVCASPFEEDDVDRALLTLVPTGDQEARRLRDAAETFEASWEPSHGTDRPLAESEPLRELANVLHGHVPAAALWQKAAAEHASRVASVMRGTAITLASDEDDYAGARKVLRLLREHPSAVSLHEQIDVDLIRLGELEADARAAQDAAANPARTQRPETRGQITRERSSATTTSTVPSPPTINYAGLLVMGGFVAALCWFPVTRPFALFLGLVTAATLVHQLGFVVVGTLAGAVVEEFSLFMGKALAQFNLPVMPLRGSARAQGHTATLSIRSLPFGGFVRFAGMDGEETGTETGFAKLSLVRRLLTMLSGAIFLLLLSAALLGLDQAWSAFSSGFGQFVHGALAPLTYGQIMLSRLSDLLTKQPADAAFGVLAAKMAAFNLLPITTLNGGQALLEIVRPRFKDTNRLSRIMVIGFTVIACQTVSWSVAVAKYVLGRPRPAVTVASSSSPPPLAFMGEITLTDPRTGKVVKIKVDRQPSQADIEEISQQVFGASEQKTVASPSSLPASASSATPAEPQTSKPQSQNFTSNQDEPEGAAAQAEAEADTNPDTDPDTDARRQRLQTEYDTLKADIEAARPRIEAEKRELAQRSDDLAAARQRLRSERRTVDEYDKQAISDFNRTVRAYNRNKDDFLARAKAHDDAVAAFNELVRRLNEKAHALDEMGN